MKFTMGNIVGKLAQATIVGTGYLTEGIGNLSELIIQDSTNQKKFKDRTDNIAKNLKHSSSEISEKISTNIDIAIVKSGEFTGSLSKKVAVALNATEENIQEAEKIGNLAGKVIIGGSIGVLTGSALISSLAATGTAGAAATTSGLAALGGGAIAAGGAGMAGGLAVTSAITATSVVATINAENDKKVQIKKSETKKGN